MISDIFQEIRERSIYISEVQKHVHDVLVAFQQDAHLQGQSISIESCDPDVNGGYLELIQRGPKQDNRVTVEINTLGNVRILRAFSEKGSLEDRRAHELHALDFETASVSAATNVLLAIADEHGGFVGTSLGAFLEAKAFDNRPHAHIPEPPQA